MVKTRLQSHAKIVRDAVNTVITGIFGRTLTHRRISETADDWGDLTASTSTNVTFTGDLQFGTDLDQRYLEQGIVEVGEGVLYIHPSALSTLPVPQDLIVDGDSVWEIVEGIEAPELGGDIVFYSYRCRRRIETGDTGE